MKDTFMAWDIKIFFFNFPLLRFCDLVSLYCFEYIPNCASKDISTILITCLIRQRILSYKKIFVHLLCVFVSNYWNFLIEKQFRNNILMLTKIEVTFFISTYVAILWFGNFIDKTKIFSFFNSINNFGNVKSIFVIFNYKQPLIFRRH